MCDSATSRCARLRARADATVRRRRRSGSRASRKPRRAVAAAASARIRTPRPSEPRGRLQAPRPAAAAAEAQPEVSRRHAAHAASAPIGGGRPASDKHNPPQRPGRGRSQACERHRPPQAKRSAAAQARLRPVERKKKKGAANPSASRTRSSTAPLAQARAKEEEGHAAPRTHPPLAAAAPEHGARTRTEEPAPPARAGPRRRDRGRPGNLRPRERALLWRAASARAWRRRPARGDGLDPRCSRYAPVRHGAETGRSRRHGSRCRRWDTFTATPLMFDRRVPRPPTRRAARASLPDGGSDQHASRLELDDARADERVPGARIGSSLDARAMTPTARGRLPHGIDNAARRQRELRARVMELFTLARTGAYPRPVRGSPARWTAGARRS